MIIAKTSVKSIWMPVVWDATPRSMVSRDAGSVFLQNVSTLLPDYTASHSKNKSLYSYRRANLKPQKPIQGWGFKNMLK